MAVNSEGFRAEPLYERLPALDRTLAILLERTSEIGPVHAD
jgi:hypothetical protein